MLIENELSRRGVPEILKFPDGSAVTADRWEERRSGLLSILADEEYGHMPPPAQVSYEILEHNNGAYANKVEYTAVKLKIQTPDSILGFPLKVYRPKLDGKLPLMLQINFRPAVPDDYTPAEEIIDRGIGLAVFYYNDVALDANDNFASGLGALYKRTDYDWGKIGQWAWAMSRALDYLLTLSWVDADNIAVAGHSRLGKTALWCGANDTRVKYVISNDSGCSGGAITREKTGEHVSDITKVFPVWFNGEYPKYANRESEMPFDQNFLLAACAPRCVLIGTSIEDTWADPFSEYLSCCSASDAYKLLGLKGFIAADRAPVAGDCFAEGNIGFHLRSGAHFFSRFDWNRYIDFIRARLG